MDDDTISHRIRDFHKDLDYVIDAYSRGKKVLLFCVIADEDTRSCERLYYVSDRIGGTQALGEIELFKKDILDNLMLGEGDIDYYEDLDK